MGRVSITLTAAAANAGSSLQTTLSKLPRVKGSADLRISDSGQPDRDLSFPSTDLVKLHTTRLLAQNKVAQFTESVASFYGALPATTPMLPTVSPFFIAGTAT